VLIPTDSDLQWRNGEYAIGAPNQKLILISVEKVKN